MKTKLVLAVLVVAISSFGISETTPIPEAKELHQDLYTIQFTLAELEEDFLVGYEWPTNSSVTYRKGGDTTPAVPKNPMIEKILQANPTYTNFATIHVSPDVEFSERNGDLKGILDSKSNTLNILQMNLSDYGITTPHTIALNSEEWMPVIFSGTNVDGKKRTYCMLIKSYAPKK